MRNDPATIRSFALKIMLLIIYHSVRASELECSLPVLNALVLTPNKGVLSPF
jgi:hypothetical protein